MSIPTEWVIAIAALIAALTFAIRTLAAARAKGMVADAETDEALTRINAQTFTDLRTDVATLRNEVITLRGEILTLTFTNQKQALENNSLKLQLEQALIHLSERNTEISELKTILLDVRQQFVAFMTRGIEQGFITGTKDMKLLKETKAEIETTKDEIKKDATE